MTLSVPHYQQSKPYTCLPACVRMVLAFHGHSYAESQLAEAFNTVPLLGTLPENVVSGLRAMDYQALWFENATAERLHALLAHGWPVITLLQAEDLPDGVAGIHAVSVIGIDGTTITFLDPMQTTPTQMPEPDFLQAWANLDNQGIVIWLQDTKATS